MRGKHAVSTAPAKRLLYGYVGFLLLLTTALALMPLGNALKEETRLVMYGCGVGFWVGIIGTLVTAMAFNRCGKRARADAQTANTGKRCGLIRFFQNKEASIADIGMLICLVGFILAELCEGMLFLAFVFLALFVFSFGMHCVLNGINYRYMKNKKRRDEE